MLHPDDLPEGTTAGDYMAVRYTVAVLVPREMADAPAAATLEGWFEYDHGRALAVDVTSRGPSPAMIVCAAERHVIAGPAAGEQRTAAELAEECEFCGDEAVAAAERRAEGGY